MFFCYLVGCDVKYRYVGERYPAAIAVKRQCVVVMSNTHKATFNVFIVVDFWLQMVANGPKRRRGTGWDGKLNMDIEWRTAQLGLE